MNKPILETLFFLNIARESICISIKNSTIKGKAPLINYVRNEASDYEVINLLAFGEMPAEKFNSTLEQKAWDKFKDIVIMNTESLKKTMLKEDINNIIYEMGPISDFGYSSATPILEFHLANGLLTEDPSTPPPSKRSTDGGVIIGSDGLTYQQRAEKIKQNAIKRKQELEKELKQKQWDKEHPTLAQGRDKAKEIGNKIATKTKDLSNQAIEKGTELKNAAQKKAEEHPYAAGAAGGALGAVALFGLYKLYKNWKAKRAAATTDAERFKADKAIASVKAKINAKKK